MVGSASPALGVVLIASQYDLYEKAFQSKQQMDSHEFSSSIVPNEKVLHPIECKPGTSTTDVLLVRHGSVVESTLQLYDLVKTTVAAEGQPSSYTCGELWVSYDITFLKPRVETSGAVEGFAKLSNAVDAECTAVAPCGATAGLEIVQTSGALFNGVTLSSNVEPNNVISITARGRFIISCSWSSVGAITADPVIAFTGFTAANFYLNNTTSSVAVYKAVRAGLDICLDTIDGATTGTIEFVSVTGMTTGNIDVLIFKIPSGSTLPPPLKMLRKPPIVMAKRREDAFETYEYVEDTPHPVPVSPSTKRTTVFKLY
jgi:hypothetical protein